MIGGNVELLTVAGVGLSALAVVALVGLLRDCLTRRPLVLFGVRVSGWPARGARSAGAAFLLAGFLIGAAGLPITSASETIDAAPASDAPPASAVTTTWRLPFYVETATRELTARGSRLGGSVERTLQLPWLFLCCVWAYWAAIVRGHPKTRAG